MFARGCVACCSCAVTIAGSGPFEAVFSRSPSPWAKVCGVAGDEAIGESDLEWDGVKSSLLLRLSMFVRLDRVTPAISRMVFGVLTGREGLYRCAGGTDVSAGLVPDLRDAFVETGEYSSG